MIAILDSVGRFVEAALTPILTAGAVSALILFVAKRWLEASITKSVEHKYAERLEGYKSELRATNDTALEKKNDLVL